MKRKNAGVTTIVVVCVMAMITALSLSLFLTASVMLKNAAGSVAAEDCRILAESFSGEIKKELTGEDKNYSDRSEVDGARVADKSELSLWHYIHTELSTGTWTYLDDSAEPIHHRENALRTFQMKRESVAGEIADTTLSMYWIQQADGKNILVVETKVTVKEQTCQVTDRYIINGQNAEWNDWSLVYEGRNETE